MTGGLEQRISLLTTHQHVTSVKNFFLFFLKILLLESAVTIVSNNYAMISQPGPVVVAGLDTVINGLLRLCTVCPFIQQFLQRITKLWKPQ